MRLVPRLLRSRSPWGEAAYRMDLVVVCRLPLAVALTQGTDCRPRKACAASGCCEMVFQIKGEASRRGHAFFIEFAMLLLQYAGIRWAICGMVRVYSSRQVVLMLLSLDGAGPASTRK